MTRSGAIKKHCLECAGTPKEVTLCQLFDCPLWEFRFGNSLKSKQFHTRMEKAKTRYPVDVAEIIEILESDSNYIQNVPNKRIKAYVAMCFLKKSLKSIG